MTGLNKKALAPGYVGVLVALCGVCGVFLPASWACEDTTLRSAALALPRDMHSLCVITRGHSQENGGVAGGLRAWLEKEAPDLNVRVEELDAEDSGVRWSDYGMPSAPPDTPVVALIGRQEAAQRAFVLDHWEPAPTEDDLNALEQSPARAALLEAVPDCDAIILYSTGKENVVSGVVDAFLRSRDTGEDGLSLKAIAFDRADPKERLLTAFAGLRGEESDWAGVVFAKGKLLVPPLLGPEVTTENLGRLVQMLEEPCTCLQSPASMGVDIPLVWDAELDAKVTPPSTLLYSEGFLMETAAVPAPTPDAVKRLEESVQANDAGLAATALVAAAIAAAVAIGLCVLLFLRVQRRRAAM